MRVLGYVFNPVSFWWCYRGDGQLACIVAEINNTFGERLPYLLSPANQLADGRHRVYGTDKRIHVSPFMSDGPELHVALLGAGRPGLRADRRHEGDLPPFRATLVAHRVELTHASLRAALVRYPLMPAKVISLIHLQAARLALKRVPFVPKPPFVPGQGTIRP